ncbi:hypothetical protein COLO4_35198 [Corchorus olitorius]|uniref:Uncharacterized protein n=1 Tax=Corchorus olitorius TaxID=93759 RepID=A0A1R3GHV6_9ROSI|nr:hypothetical protein COLO4_35198 [Corchorus olitorius]
MEHMANSSLAALFGVECFAWYWSWAVPSNSLKFEAGEFVIN